MRSYPALLALFVSGPVLAHLPDGDAGLSGGLLHQLVSLHHAPGMLILLAWASLLVLALRRNRSGQ